MRIDGAGALVAGGASGLGAATARALAARGATVAIFDRDEAGAEALADEIGGSAFGGDVTSEEDVAAAVAGAVEAAGGGGLRICASCAGIPWGERTVGRDGPAALEPFERVVRVNLIGMFNVLRHAAAAIARAEPGEDGERGVVVMTASIAAFDGQIGQAAYAASKGGVAALTLPAARDLARQGVRVCTIAPGTFDTPMLATLPQETRDALAAGIPFPQRLGRPDDFAALAIHIAENPYLNGETIRLDGALRMPPR